LRNPTIKLALVVGRASEQALIWVSHWPFTYEFTEENIARSLAGNG
jgi:hypothetical protein